MGKKTVLYIHGMGGGACSRIPSVLKEHFDSIKTDELAIDVVARTYDFDPEIGAGQIALWVEELKPDMVIGESLGSIQALRVTGMPHLFVSPSLNGPVYLGRLSFLALIPGFTWLFNKIYTDNDGIERQKMKFTFKVLRKYNQHRKAALKNTTLNGSKDYFYAFIGDFDHYKKSGVVRTRTWIKYFGENTYSTYPGTHFMEEEYLHSLLIPKIVSVLTK